MLTNSISKTRKWDWVYKIRRQSLYSLPQRNQWTSKETNSSVVPILKQQSFNPSIKKFARHGNQLTVLASKKINFTRHEYHHFSRSDITLHTRVKICGLLRRLAISIPTVAMSEAFLSFLVHVNWPKKCVLRNFAWPTRLKNHSVEALTDVQSSPSTARCATLPVKIKETRVSWCVTRRLFYLEKS